MLPNTKKYEKIFLHKVSQKQTGKLELRTQIKREWYISGLCLGILSVVSENCKMGGQVASYAKKKES